jgi:hypothetical protein
VFALALMQYVMSVLTVTGILKVRKASIEMNSRLIVEKIVDG